MRGRENLSWGRAFHLESVDVSFTSFEFDIESNEWQEPQPVTGAGSIDMQVGANGELLTSSLIFRSAILAEAEGDGAPGELILQTIRSGSNRI